MKRDYISDEPFGPYLVLGANAEELAGQVAHYVKHPQQRAERIQRAFEYAGTLNWQRTAGAYLRLWSTRSVNAPDSHGWVGRAALALKLCEEAS